jgi:secreted trypsin-like serine protease
MKTKTLINTAISLVLLTSASSVFSESVNSRIFNGEVANTGEFPFYTAIIINNITDPQINNHQCGGVLVDKNWLLTAAHCVDSMDASKYGAVIGLEQYWPKPIYTETAGFAKIIIHPEYDQRGQNDIALVKLTKSVTSDNFAKLDGIDANIALPTGTPLTAIGFGRTNTATVSPVLLKAQTEVIANHYCIDKPEGYPDTNFNPVNNLCTGNPGTLQGSTGSGDSGGPFMSLNSHGDYVVSGLVSRSLWRPAEQTTKVAYHATWIQKTIASNSTK